MMHCETHGPSIPQSESKSPSNRKLNEIYKNQDGLSAQAELCGNDSDKSEIHLKSTDNFDSKNELHDEDRGSNKFIGHVNGSPDVIDTLTSATEILRNPIISKLIFPHERKDEARKNKFSVAQISSKNSVSVDFRLSRGIAEVNEGKYDDAISIFDKILKEDRAYPEALIGRGTTYAFQRELDAAIADFTKAIQFNPMAGEAWKRRGQAQAALGEFVEAIEDLTKALEFEPNTEDILHERV
ncbi:unnamed protein product [Lupinus luteus]|uniref:Tetratricopeptide repeat protein n=1 Tax=Lupinus luteus TaxID=3873 RepID=A0AAV1XD85_LUPLU